MIVRLVADGETPIPDVIRECESRLRDGEAARTAEGLVLDVLSGLEALAGRFDESRDALDRARARFFEAGDDAAVATDWTWSAAYLEVLALDAARADSIARPALAVAEARGDRNWQSQFSALLAEAALAGGDHRRALTLADRARTAATTTDVFNELAWRLPRALALVGLGELAEAELLAREAVTLADPTEYLLGRGQARVVHAEALAALGDVDAAIASANDGAELLEAKGATLLAERAQERVAALR